MSLQKPNIRVLLWLLCAGLWFGTLGIRSLVHPDEGRYSEISREMAVPGGDWVTPHLNGLKYFEKPPLQYWATAVAFRVLGESDFSARLWGGLCGFLTLLLLWRTARRLWGDATGDYAALVGGGMLGLMAISHVVTLDMGVSFFLTLALCGFLRAHHDGAMPQENRRWMLITWAAMAGALLSKGLIGVALPGAALILYSLICRDWKPWTRMQWLRGLPLFALLGLPWHLLVAQRNPEWAHFYFIHEHLERFTTTEHHRTGAWYYFVPILVGGLLPWTTLLPQAVRAGWREAASGFKADRFLIVWSVFIFVFFSFSSSKLPGYIIPVLPALSLLLARWLRTVPAIALRPHAIVILVLMLGLAVGAPIFGHTASERTPMEYNQAFSWWILGAALGYAALAALAMRAAGQERKLAATTLLAGGGLGFLCLIMAGYDNFSPLSSSARLADKLRPELAGNPPVYSIHVYDQTMPYYFGRPVTLVEYVDEFELGEQQQTDGWLPTLEAFEQRWAAEPHALAVTDLNTYKQLQEHNIPMKILDQDPRRVVVSKP